MVETVITGHPVPEDKKIIVALCYVLGLLGGIILFLLAGDDKNLKYHAMQAIIMGLVMYILCFVCIGIFVWFYLIWGAYLVYSTGDFKSVVTGIAEGQAK